MGFQPSGMLGYRFENCWVPKETSCLGQQYLMTPLFTSMADACGWWWPGEEMKMWVLPSASFTTPSAPLLSAPGVCSCGLLPWRSSHKHKAYFENMFSLHQQCDHYPGVDWSCWRPGPVRPQQLPWWWEDPGVPPCSLSTSLYHPGDAPLASPLWWPQLVVSFMKQQPLASYSGETRMGSHSWTKPQLPEPSWACMPIAVVPLQNVIKHIWKGNRLFSTSAYCCCFVVINKGKQTASKPCVQATAGWSDRVRSCLLTSWELVATSERGPWDKFPPNLHCPLVAMHQPCALAGPVGVGALSGEQPCLGECAIPLPGQPSLPFFPKLISPDVVCVCVPQALINSNFRVASFLAKTDHLPRNDKRTKTCNLFTSVTSVRNYQHKITIFFLTFFFFLHIYVYLQKWAL